MRVSPCQAPPGEHSPVAACQPSTCHMSHPYPCCSGRAEQLSCLAAPERCSSHWVPPGLGCRLQTNSLQHLQGSVRLSALAGVRHHRLWLLGSPISFICAGWAKGGGKDGAGLHVGEAGTETASGHCRKRYNLPGASWRDSACISSVSAAREEKIGGKLDRRGSWGPAPRLLTAEPWSAPPSLSGS